jgi:hypothetical protein
MNTFVAIILWVIMFLLGFMAATCACLTKITRLEQENKTLAEWLQASRKTNEILVKESNELLADLEAAVNGKSIINTEDETKTD